MDKRKAYKVDKARIQQILAAMFYLSNLGKGDLYDADHITMFTHKEFETSVDKRTWVVTEVRPSVVSPEQWYMEG